VKELRLKMQGLTNPTILTSHEIKNILGGSGESGGSSGDYCKITAYTAGNPIISNYPFHGTCEEQQTKANQTCLDIIGAVFERCTYDCSCDGIGH
jgi:hypothetical protein